MANGKGFSTWAVEVDGETFVVVDRLRDDGPEIVELLTVDESVALGLAIAETALKATRRRKGLG